eukprot:366212-Chlamydomonas_euryale.AAC.32
MPVLRTARSGLPFVTAPSPLFVSPLPETLNLACLYSARQATGHQVTSGCLTVKEQRGLGCQVSQAYVINDYDCCPAMTNVYTGPTWRLLEFWAAHLAEISEVVLPQEMLRCLPHALNI